METNSPEGLVKNKEQLWKGLVFIAASIILLLPFPHRRPLGDTIIMELGLPAYSNMQTETGFHFVGIAVFIMVIYGLSQVSQALNKWRKRMVILGIIAVLTMPIWLVETYQSSLARGIYTVGFDKERSHCTFEQLDGSREASIDCMIPLENHSNETVEFEIIFEKSRFQEDETYSLINRAGPHYVTLLPGQRKQVEFRETIHLTEVDFYSQWGQSGFVDIILKDSQGRERQL
ncbi:MAG: hypothetical protein LRY73_05980 [Bacillus sp. (in: Bacteria)]|nr:hypothetical protein [Bacillus sp. (in: firmicutes)]